MAASFTARQGQFLAFIYWYTKLNREPPAESDVAWSSGSRRFRRT